MARFFWTFFSQPLLRSLNIWICQGSLEVTPFLHRPPPYVKTFLGLFKGLLAILALIKAPALRELSFSRPSCRNGTRFPSLKSSSIVRCWRCEKIHRCNCSARSRTIPISCYGTRVHTFHCIERNVDNVRHVFIYCWKSPSTLEHDGAKAVCEAFPGVGHLLLQGGQFPHFFQEKPTEEVGPTPHTCRYLIDSWTKLGSSTVVFMGPCGQYCSGVGLKSDEHWGCHSCV